jgi:hypothetical protein
MLLSALEALFFLVLTVKILLKVGILKTIKMITKEPIILFCILFALVLAFAVGVNSGNFGTLVRYKIPLMPYYLAALYILQAKAKDEETIKKISKKRVMVKEF